MKLIIIVLATISVGLYFLRIIQGSKYNEYIEGLQGSDFPLKSLYTVGYGWLNAHFFGIRNMKHDELCRQASLLYELQYADYYANAVWCQAISYAHLGICVMLTLLAATGSGFLVVIVATFTIVFVAYSLIRMKAKLEERESACVSELPEIVSSMALLVNSGMILKEAWKTIAYSKDSIIYVFMQEACDDIENGVPDDEAIYQFGLRTSSQNVKKFTSLLIQGLDKGSADLSRYLMEQTSEMWELKKQVMLQKGEIAATKLVGPTALILLGIIIVIIVTAIGMLF